MLKTVEYQLQLMTNFQLIINEVFMSEKFDLEKAFSDLDAKVLALEDENISLEDSFKVYQEGIDLIVKCNASIEEVEGKVRVLEENGGTHEFQRKS